MTDQPSEPLKLAFEKKSDRLQLAAKITADRLKLFVDCRALAAGTFTAEELLALLAGVEPKLLHLDVISDIAACLTRGEAVEHRRVAKGRPPIAGRDGKILFLVKKYQRLKTPQGIEVVDPRYLRFFDNQEKGTIVGRVYAPTEGAEGMDVFGAPLKPTPGKPAKYSVDSSLAVTRAPTENFETITAQEAGYLNEEGGKLAVRSELALDADIDFRTGDVDFVGGVSVRGSVLKDFRVSARGNIVISGDILDSAVLSAKGAVTVRGGIVGSGLLAETGKLDRRTLQTETTYFAAGAMVRAFGNVEAYLVQGSVVEAWGDVVVEREVGSSVVRTRGLLRLSKGHLYGGETYVTCGAEAQAIGTSIGTKTVIYLCSDVESSAEYSHLLFRIEQLRAAREMIRLQLGPYEKGAGRLQMLKEPYRGKVKKLFEKHAHLKESFERLDRERLRLLASAHQRPIVRVNFLGTLYPGVVIAAGNERFVPKSPLAGPGSVEYDAAQKMFTVTELRPLAGSAPSDNQP